MCITQPTMSFQIRALERELQIQLFEREHNGVHLTDAGKIVQNGFLHIMDSYRRVVDAALATAYGRVQLKIGYHGFINWAGIHSFLAAFSSRHPELEVSIIQNQWKELADYLENGCLDVAFLFGPELRGRSGLSSLALFKEKTCFAVPPSHPLADRLSVTAEDLKDETILMNNHSSDSMDELVKRLILSGIPEDHMKFVDAPDIALAMTVAGQGLTSMPISYRQDHLPLNYVEYDTPHCHMEYSLVWNTTTSNPAVRLFCAEVSRVSWPYRQEKTV